MPINVYKRISDKALPLLRLLVLLVMIIIILIKTLLLPHMPPAYMKKNNENLRMFDI